MLSDLKNVQMATVGATRNGRKVTASRVSEKTFPSNVLAMGQHLQ